MKKRIFILVDGQQIGFIDIDGNDVVAVTGNGNRSGTVEELTSPKDMDLTAVDFKEVH